MFFYRVFEDFSGLKQIGDNFRANGKDRRQRVGKRRKSAGLAGRRQ
jgi:hypothetical protein